MKQNRLTILAMISLSLLAVFCCGYVSRCEVIYVGKNPTGLNTRLTALAFEEGRIRILLESFVPPFTRTIAIPGNRLSVTFHPRLPSISRSIWEFDAHSVNIQKGVNAFIFAFPIWCVALPFTIAPILWLRRRSASKEQRGFTVEPSNGETALKQCAAISA